MTYDYDDDNGYPQNNSVYVPKNFRNEFSKIREAFQSTATHDSVAKGELLFANESTVRRSPSVYELVVGNGVTFPNGYPDGTTVWWVPKKNNVGDANIRLNRGPLRPIRQYVRSGANESDVQSTPLPANAILQGVLTGVMFAGGVGRIIYPLGSLDVEITYEHEFAALVDPIEVSDELQSEDELVEPGVWEHLFEEPIGWRSYNDLVVTLDTPAGRLTRTIPTTALLRTSASSLEQGDAFTRMDSHVLLFGQNDNVWMWLAPSTSVVNQVLISTESPQFLPGLKVYGRTSPGVSIQYDRVNTWVPQFRYLTRQNPSHPERTQTFVQVFGYDGGVEALPPPAHPYIIGSSGRIFPSTVEEDDPSTSLLTPSGLSDYQGVNLSNAVAIQSEQIMGDWQVVVDEAGTDFGTFTNNVERIITNSDVEQNGRNIILKGGFDHDIISNEHEASQRWPVLFLYGDIVKPIRINNLSVAPVYIAGSQQEGNNGETLSYSVLVNATILPGQSRTLTPYHDSVQGIRYYVVNGSTNHAIRINKGFGETLSAEQEALLPTMTLNDDGTIQSIDTGTIPTIGDWILHGVDGTRASVRAGQDNAAAYGAENLIFSVFTDPSSSTTHMGADNNREAFVMKVDLTTNEEYWRMDTLTVQNRNEHYPLILLDRTGLLTKPQVVIKPYYSVAWSLER